MLHTLPITGKALRSIWRVRSPEIAVQLLPRSVLLKSLFAAKYKVLLSWGLMSRGASQFQR